MDSPAAVRAFRTYGRNRICYGRTRQSRPQRIDNRGAHLADEYRHDRKRSIDRNRRALRFPLRSRDHFLVGLCLAKKIPMAHLVANIDLPRVGLVGERAAPSRIFLWDRLRRQSRARLAAPIQHAGIGSSLMVAGYDLCRQCMAMASANAVGERTSVD